MLDLLVVGAGLSGLMAAYAAAQAGLQVRVVAKGLGALHWSAGTIDLLGLYDELAIPQSRFVDLLKRMPDYRARSS